MSFEVEDELALKKYRGMGNKYLSTYGFVTCIVELRKRDYKHDFLVLPDNEAVLPFLIGRDLMTKMDIHLCQMVKRYSKNELLNLRDANKYKITFDINAPRLFNLLMCPIVTEPTTINQCNGKIPSNVCNKRENIDFNMERKINLAKEKVMNNGFVPKVVETGIGYNNLERKEE